VGPQSYTVTQGTPAFYALLPVQIAPVAYAVSDQASVGALLLVPTFYHWGDLTGTWGSYTQPWSAFTGRGVFRVATGDISVGGLQNSEFSGSCTFPGSSALRVDLRLGASEAVQMQQSTTLGAQLLVSASESPSIVGGATPRLTSAVHAAGQIDASGVVDTGLIAILTAFSSRAGRSSATWRI
jgi:hypothetical protein